MQKTLYSLLELQEIDNRLDELREERGDLPLIVKELQEKLDSKIQEMEKNQETLKNARLRHRELELIIEDSREKLSKFEEQLYQVKTNKEYDAITAETDSAKDQLNKSETELLEIDEDMEALEESIHSIEAEIGKLEQELSENKEELEQTLNATAEEENLLRQEREIIINKADPQLIKTYELVREARGGQGVAIVTNGVCGGCYSYIPPQKIVEVKKMEKIYTCEICGRILVWDEIHSK